MSLYLSSGKAHFKNQDGQYVPIDVLVQSNGNPTVDITVDTQMSSTSTNPVQNRVIKNYVDTTVSTNNAHFRGTFTSIDDLPTVAQGVTNNDYAWVQTIEDGNTVYNRYKFTDTFNEWRFEYSLANTTFTPEQWNTINSGVTEQDISNIQSAISSMPNMEVLTLDEYMDLSTEEKNNGKFYCITEE